MILSTLLWAAQQAAPAQLPHSLQPETLRADLEFLASDAMLGRRTGEFGARAASEWIRSRFMRAGLQPFQQGWYQNFPAEPLHLKIDETYMAVGEKRVDAGNDYLPHPTSPSGTVTAPAVFVGFGLHAPERDYDDFAGVDLQGKIAVLYRWEPDASDALSKFDGKRMLPQAQLDEKIRACAERGAIAVLVTTPPDNLQKATATARAFWPSTSPIWDIVSSPMLAQQVDLEELAATNFDLDDIANQTMTIMQNSTPLGATIPVSYCSPRVMRGMLRKMGLDSKQWVAEVNENLKPNSFPMPFELTVSVQTKPVEVIGRNVIGLLPGSDPELADEYIVVGAHYDHVGMNEAGEIWNGADDNGSGTVGLLGLIDAITALPADQRPRRSIVFLAFSGEELGLIGSYQFLVGGFIDPAKIVGMVNTDMIGRAADNSVYAVGTQSGEGLGDLVRAQGEGIPIKLRFDNEEFFDRSDQVGFYYAGVPIVFFNTDEHDDYHTPRDTADLIHYDDMSAICHVAFRTIVSLSNLDEKLDFVDAYGRLQPVYGQPAALPIPFPVRWEDRLDY